MSFNLLDVVKSHFNSDLVSKVASFLGENEGGISKAMGGVIPTVLSGLAAKAHSSTGAQEVADMANDAHQSGILDNIGNFFSGNDMLSKGSALVSSLFGSKTSGITDVISGMSGIKSGSTSSLLSMALPIVLGALGKHSAENNLGASGISSILSSGKSSWANLLPGGLGNILGGVGTAVSGLTGNAKDVTANVTNHASDAMETTSGGVKWLLPLLLLGALGFLAWYLLGNKGCGKKPHSTTTDGKDTSGLKGKDTSGATIMMPTKESMKVKLIDGTEIEAFKGGIESQLVAFLNDKNAMIDTAKGNWFDFDNLNFKLGKSDLTDSSMVQIKNIVAILKAYPAVKMKIGGYTDASGNAANNLTLSGARANAVKNAIVAAGGNAAQVTGAEGYGSKFAKEPATASDEARRKDRRTAVKIVAK